MLAVATTVSSEEDQEKRALVRYAAHRLRQLRGPEEAVAMSYQAIADRLKITKPQVHNIINLTEGPTGYGPKVERALALHFFGGSVDKLRAAALSWFELQKDVNETFVAEEVSAVVARAASVHGYTPEEAWAASGLARGLVGFEISEEQALEFLSAARDGRQRFARRYGGTVAADAGGSPVDDLGGGAGSMPKRPKRRK